MKIAYITPTFLPNLGGAEVLLHNLASRIVSAGGAEVTVYTHSRLVNLLRRQGVLSDLPYRVKGWPPVLTRLAGFGLQMLKEYIRKEQRANQYDLWHAAVADPSGYVLTGLSGVPKVLFCPGADIQISEELNYGIRRNPAVNKRVVEAVRDADVLAAQSRSIADEFAKITGSEEKVRIIAHGVDRRRFKRNKAQLSIRGELNIPPEKKILITIGRNHPKKGYGYIPAAVRALAEKRDDFLWYVIGKNVHEIQSCADYQAVKKYLVLEDQIGTALTGSLVERLQQLPSAELIQYLHASDIFVFPTLLESFGIVTIEAMAAGVPVVTTDAPGSRDIIHDGENGLAVRAKDPQALANALHRLLEDPVLQAALVKKASEDIETLYDWPVIVQQHLDLYAALMKKRQVSSRRP